MIKNTCKHEWEKQTDSNYNNDVGSIPSYYMCKKCRTSMTGPEMLQLEALENQNQTLKHIKGFQKYMAIAAFIISAIALVISIFGNNAASFIP